MQPFTLASLRAPSRLFITTLLASAALVACGGSDDEPRTPVSLKLEKIGSFETGIFGKSAAEIPAFDAASRRAFVVNAQAERWTCWT